MKIDDRTGLEIAEALDVMVEKKSRRPIHALVLYGILAGIYIGFGAVAATTVGAYGDMPVGLTRFLSASVFCVGLVLVIIPGSELFTGNALMSAGLISGKVSTGRVLRNWGFVYLGNFAGAILLALVMFGTGLLGTSEAPSPVGEAAARIATLKLEIPFGQALLRGVLCNILVCLAVVLAISSRTTVGKILGIYFPIMTFVLCGFEHSIANMYFLPVGLLVEGKFLSGFTSIFGNLVPVTIGNVIGGIMVVALHPSRVERLWRRMHHHRQAD